MTKMGIFKDWNKIFYKDFFKEGVPFEIFGKVYFPFDNDYSYLVKKSKWSTNDTTYANISAMLDTSNYTWTSYTGHELADYNGLRTILFIRESQVVLIEPTNKGNKNLLDKGDFQ